jgi:hypothetical protein
VSFVVKKDDPFNGYLVVPTDSCLRRTWGPRKSAHRFAARRVAYEAALSAMNGYNVNVRVVRLIPRPPKPCKRCGGTGLVTPRATNVTKGK